MVRLSLIIRFSQQVFELTPDNGHIYATQEPIGACDPALERRVGGGKQLFTGA